MRSVEVEAATVDEAIDEALRRLGVERGAVSVAVLDPTAARVRVTLRGAEVSPETAGALAQQVLVETLRRLELACDVAAKAGDEPGTTVLDVSGADEALVIGRHGQVLDALEHVLNRIAFRDDYGAGRIMVDVDGYRQRREESLQALAQRLAERAKETGRPVTLDPMTARDRRVVHLALQSDPGVVTRSEGEGQFRRLVIVPHTSARRSS